MLGQYKWSGGAQIDLCRFHKPVVVILSISVPRERRKNGFGSSLLDFVCRIADGERLILLLEVIPSGGHMTYEALVRWYEKRGFEQYKDNVYYRFPKE